MCESVADEKVQRDRLTGCGWFGESLTSFCEQEIGANWKSKMSQSCDPLAEAVADFPDAERIKQQHTEGKGPHLAHLEICQSVSERYGNGDLPTHRVKVEQ